MSEGKKEGESSRSKGQNLKQAMGGTKPSKTHPNPKALAQRLCQSAKGPQEGEARKGAAKDHTPKSQVRPQAGSHTHPTNPKDTSKLTLPHEKPPRTQKHEKQFKKEKHTQQFNSWGSLQLSQKDRDPHVGLVSSQRYFTLGCHETALWTQWARAANNTPTPATASNPS